MEKIALIVIDLQRDFLDCSNNKVGRLAKAICLPGVKKLLAHGRNLQWNIIHVITEHQSEETLPKPLRNSGTRLYCEAGTNGVRILDGLQRDDENIVKKHSYSAFSSTELETLIMESPTIVLAGVAADCCILHTAAEACTRLQKDVYLPYQSISSSTVDDYIFGLKAAAKSLAAVVDLSDILGDKIIEWSLRKEPKQVEGILRHWFEPIFIKVKEIENNGGLLEENLQELENLISF